MNGLDTVDDEMGVDEAIGVERGGGIEGGGIIVRKASAVLWVMAG